jgi:hypothetical protein
VGRYLQAASFDQFSATTQKTASAGQRKSDPSDVSLEWSLPMNSDNPYKLSTTAGGPTLLLRNTTVMFVPV